MCETRKYLNELVKIVKYSKCPKNTMSCWCAMSFKESLQLVLCEDEKEKTLRVFKARQFLIGGMEGSKVELANIKLTNYS